MPWNVLVVVCRCLKAEYANRYLNSNSLAKTPFGRYTVQVAATVCLPL